jgi:hypothetical protein
MAADEKTKAAANQVFSGLLRPSAAVVCGHLRLRTPFSTGFQMMFI